MIFNLILSKSCYSSVERVGYYDYYSFVKFRPVFEILYSKRPAYMHIQLIHDRGGYGFGLLNSV